MSDRKEHFMDSDFCRNHPENERLIRRYLAKLKEANPGVDYRINLPVKIESPGGDRPGFVLDREAGKFTGQVYGLIVYGPEDKLDDRMLARPLFDLCADEGIEVLANPKGEPIRTVDRMTGELHALEIDNGFGGWLKGARAIFLDQQSGSQWYNARDLVPYRK